mmetsp:Transcript_642/g.2339  ORF Transcript_642/g.2339 Transcript_642/m.2339 type:complete len:388 (-) Transcript_642:207-1370(-)
MPWSMSVARTRYGVSFRSRFSRFSRRSMSEKSCTHTWSCLKSSPRLKMMPYFLSPGGAGSAGALAHAAAAAAAVASSRAPASASGSSTTNVSLSGASADLKTVHSLGTIRRARMEGSSGSGRGLPADVSSSSSPSSERSVRRRSPFLLAPLADSSLPAMATSCFKNCVWRRYVSRSSSTAGPRSSDACSNMLRMCPARSEKLASASSTKRYHCRKLARVALRTARLTRKRASGESSSASKRSACTSWRRYASTSSSEARASTATPCARTAALSKLGLKSSSPVAGSTSAHCSISSVACFASPASFQSTLCRNLVSAEGSALSEYRNFHSVLRSSCERVAPGGERSALARSLRSVPSGLSSRSTKARSTMPRASFCCLRSLGFSNPYS